jgi:ubiquinone/menaquinone biosynthesis C-methylase UbiE
MGEYLATGFAAIDRVGDPHVYTDCLRLLGEHPEMRAIKDESLACLDLLSGGRALEIGCGLGVEAIAMARSVGPGGVMAALDASTAMLGRLVAATGGEATPRPHPVAGDGASLPFTDAVFDACRVERTLQHVPDPGVVVAEMARVVRPGGLVLAVEPDWGAFVVDSDLRETARTVAVSWCDSFRSGWIGRSLPRLMAEAGLVDVTVSPRPFLLYSLAAAEAVYNLSVTVDRAVAAGVLSLEAAGAFKAEQRRRDAAGQFFAALTFFMVSGRRPDGQGE